jgi:hypothetical protein
MSNYTRLFVDPAGTYSGGYTSEVINGHDHDSSNQPRGIIQVELTSGTVDLQYRVDPEASWLTVRQYTANAMEEAAVLPYMRIVASNAAKVWFSEII